MKQMTNGTTFNLSEEERGGYLVSSEMKRIWSVELDLLAKFIEVCEQNGLTYYADGGTLLGAVRHGGFIPWDNDIDVAMPRPDFDRLLALGHTAFKYPYFFQMPKTESGRYFRPWVKICNSETTGGSREDFEKGLNCGIFIDVFPLDKIPEGSISRWWYLSRLDAIRKSARFCFGMNSPSGLFSKLKYYFRKFIYKVFWGAPDAVGLFEKYQKIAGCSWGSESNVLADVSHGFVERFTWNFSDWTDSTQMWFENLKICIPTGYDAILTKQYSDYMSYPKDKSTHSYLEFNPEIPYGKFFSKE